MKLTSKQLRAVLAMLTSLPARLRLLSARNNAGPRRSPPQSGEPLRTGPWLADWRQAQRVPVSESVHPTAQRLILAALRHEMVGLRYWGGRTPGRERRISPELVFQLGGCGPLYVSAYCHLRRAERVFNVGRMELLPDEGEIVCITE